jgi:hypothetical protein
MTLMGLCAGKEVGDRATLDKIRLAKESDPLYQNMMEDDKKEAIDLLLAHRQGKSLKARVTSKGAARDIFATMEKIEIEVRNQS